MRSDGQTGIQCAIFRNESTRKSSEIILECEKLAAEHWGAGIRMYTYVDPTKIRSVNPGACFKHAGWTTVRNPDGTIRVSNAGLDSIPARRESPVEEKPAKPAVTTFFRVRDSPSPALNS